MRRLPIIFVWILALCALGSGQSEATKVDEFGKVTCDDFLARADNFFITLNNNPTARGFFLINGDDKHKGVPLAYSHLLDDAIAARRYDRSRVEIVHAASSQGVGASFWMVPQGASIPTSWSSVWDFTLPPNRKPFMWSSDFAEMCGSPPNVALITKYLEANPGSRIHVVIHATTLRNRRAGLLEAKAALNGIPSNRIRYFYRKLAGYVIPVNDYWFVPKKS